jgi:hypothetical protein
MTANQRVINEELMRWDVVIMKKGVKTSIKKS